MASSSLKLTDAIEANRNGLESLNRRRHDKAEQRDLLVRELRLLDAEILARAEMQSAMEKLQAVYPENETIKFVVPYGA